MSEIAGFVRRRVELPGIGLSVQEAGAGAPLILLHGWTSSHQAPADGAFTVKRSQRASREYPPT